MPIPRIAVTFVDGDPVEVGEVVVAGGEPAVVDAAVVGTRGEHQAEPGQFAADLGGEGDRALPHEVLETLTVEAADGRRVGLVDGERGLVVVGSEVADDRSGVVHPEIHGR